MKHIRYYGASPISLGVVHGGPGGIGSCADLAEELAKRLNIGVAEFLQTKYNIADLCDELTGQIAFHSPLILLGHSWGAWLAALTAAKNPAMVSKLILVGTPPLRHGVDVDQIRRRRFTPELSAKYSRLLTQLPEHPELLDELGKICDNADTFCRAELPANAAACFDGKMFDAIWCEASALRAAGVIEAKFRALEVPCVAIHGDYDSHPASEIVRFFPQNHILPRCGHTPGHEKYARDDFFDLLYQELKQCE